MVQHLISPKRVAVQWLASIAALGIPFVRIGGESLLRLDAPTRTLLFFGARIRIDEFYLFLLAILIIVFGFLFITMVFGRVWCGWLCPQSTLTDLAEYLDRRIGALLGTGKAATAVRHGAYLALAGVTAANLVWYFIAPHEFFMRLARGEIGPVAGITLLAVVLLVYGDLAFVRRAICRTVCPYGRIQLATTDRNTLTLEFDRSRAACCIRCGSCVNACPTGIDIRNGLQVECINCGRCLDACRVVMGERGEPGLIRYTFGRSEEGGGRPLNVRSALMASVVMVLAGLLVTGTLTRREASLSVRRAGEGEVRRLPDGAAIAFFSAYLENRSMVTSSFDLHVEVPLRGRAELLGPVTAIVVPPNENRRVDFLVKLMPAPATELMVTVVLTRGGERITAADVRFPVY
ncbi:MAG: 4Fe-4S binding protein [Desulfuromonadales bacterium]|nr:MAG: 4Fe-4S binding protein [Desulfuromonadales bacterium]